jgi:hypothetical protein
LGDTRTVTPSVVALTAKKESRMLVTIPRP